MSMLSVVEKFKAFEKKNSNHLLLDIAQACLQTPFISEAPKFFVHVDHSFIEIHIRKDAFSNDQILRDTAIDAGILINAILGLMMKLGHETITDFEMKESGTIRVARISMGVNFTDEMQHKINYTRNTMYGLSQAMQLGSKEESIKRELQGILIERQLYVQQSNVNHVETQHAQFVILGAYFHLGGWMEAGMTIGKAMEHVNKTLNTKIHICNSSKCTHVVSEQDRNRGRFVLVGFSTENLDHKITKRELDDYFV
jgi:hypothetical protein